MSEPQNPPEGAAKPREGLTGGRLLAMIFFVHFAFIMLGFAAALTVATFVKALQAMGVW